MKKSKTLSLVLVLALLVSMCSMLAGCGSSSQPAAQPAGDSANPEMPNIVMALQAPAIPTDVKTVEDALNEILKEKIGVTVTIEYFTYADFSQKMNLILANSNEKMDLIPLIGADWTPNVTAGKLRDISVEYEEYGKGIQEYLDDVYLDAGRLNGKLYGVPAIYCWAVNAALFIRTDILEMAGLSEIPESMEMSELTDLFAKINAGGNTIPILGVENENSILARVEPYDGLTDEFGVLMDYGNSTKVENWYASKEYKELLDLVYSWNQAGYIAPDMEITTDYSATLVKNNVCAGWISNGDPGALTTQEALCGYDLTMIQLTKPTASTNTVGMTHWAIPVNCTDPVSAMKVLNEMYCNPAVVDVIDFGVEGVHYVRNEDGSMRLPDGLTQDTNGYFPHTSWYVGNQFISSVWESDGLDFNRNMQEYVAQTVPSKAMGFTFNSEDYATELAALTNARDQYRAALECGVVNPDEVLPQMLKALEDADIQVVMDAKQQQYDAWLASK